MSDKRKVKRILIVAWVACLTIAMALSVCYIYRLRGHIIRMSIKYPEQIDELNFEIEKQNAKLEIIARRGGDSSLVDSYGKISSSFFTETFQTQKDRMLHQGIAQYNGEIFEFDFGECVYQGKHYEIKNEHGNNCNFGTELHGDFPYLYCGSWNQDTCDIYINSFDGEKFELVDTIHFDKEGYLNAYVDEAEDTGYVFIEDNPDIGKIEFIRFRLSTREILEDRVLPYKMPVVQGIDMYDDFIYASAGFGTDDMRYPDCIYKISRDGILVDRISIDGLEEMEGIAFIDGTPVIATSWHFYYLDPVVDD